MNTPTDPAAPATPPSPSTNPSPAVPEATNSTPTTPASPTGAPTDPNAPPTPAAPAAPGADTPWQDGLAGDLKTNPLFRTYKTVDDLAKAHDHLTKLKGASAAELLKIPAKPQDQAPEDWAPIHKALGVPEDPKDYQITLAPEAATDAPALEGVLRELGGKAKFYPAQMAAVIETLNTLGQQAVAQETEALATETKTVNDTLNKEWGAAAEGNRRAMGKLMRDAIDASLSHIKDPTAKAEALEAAQADLESKLGSNLTMTRVLAYAIGKMAEPEIPEGGGASAGGDKPLTPAAATAAINALYADKDKMTALRTSSHPQHGAVLAERNRLLAFQRGDDQRPDKRA